MKNKVIQLRAYNIARQRTGARLNTLVAVFFFVGSYLVSDGVWSHEIIIPILCGFACLLEVRTCRKKIRGFR